MKNRHWWRQIGGWLLMGSLLAGAGGCASGFKTVQLLRSPGELEHPQTATWVRSIRVTADAVKVTGVDGQTQVLSPMEVWGYRTAQGEVYRLFGKMAYELVQSGDLQLYLDRLPDGRVIKENYYFSLTPDGDLWYLNRKNIRLVFRDNPCVLHLLQNVRVNQLVQPDADGSYWLVNAYRHCQEDRLTSQ